MNMKTNENEQLSSVDYETIDLILEKSDALNKREMVERLALLSYNTTVIDNKSLVDAYRDAYNFILHITNKGY